jgi:hypothetical protein
VTKSLADRLNGALNKTVSDAHLTVSPVASDPNGNTFQLERSSTAKMFRWSCVAPPRVCLCSR